MTEHVNRKQTALEILRAAHRQTVQSRIQIEDLFEAIEVAHSFTRNRISDQFESLKRFFSKQPTANDIQLEFNNLVDRIWEDRALTVPTAMRAAAIILAHSHADASLNNLLAVCVYNDWEYWSSRVAKRSKRTFSLVEVLKLNTASLVSSETLNFLNASKHKSLPNRSEMILAHVGKFGRDSAASRMSGSDLKEFDEKRHAIVHQNLAQREKIQADWPAACIGILDHLENLNESVGEMLDLNWREITRTELDDL